MSDSEYLTVEEIRQVLADIEAERGDDENAHAMQDHLFRQVLTAIAKGNPYSWLLAEEALKVDQIDFARWYA